MSKTVINIENISKLYRLGEVGTGTLSHDLNRWWARARGLEDPYMQVGMENDRTGNRHSDYVWALDDINLNINEGEIIGIIGRNGAGKSTLLKLISRITAPTTGCIRIRGRVGSLLEVGTGMHPQMTARENIFLNGAILGMRRQEIANKFDDIMDFSGCSLYVDTPIKRFSTGMRVRLGFAVAAYLEPEILVVDEVLAVGDLQFQKKCLGKMEEINKTGRTILFVSHNMAAMKSLCEKGIALDNGKIACTGSMEKVINYYSSINNKQKNSRAIYKNSQLNGTSNSKAELLEAYVTDMHGNISSRVNVDEEFTVHIKWRLGLEVPFFRIGLEFTDPLGTVILMTEDTDLTGLYGKTRRPGIYKQKVTVSSFLLMPGIYSVNVFGGMPRIERLLEENSIIQFELEENNTHLSSVTGEMRSGYISTPLSWDMEYTDAD